MQARWLAAAGLLALVAGACSPAPVDENARAIFGDSTGVGVTLALDRASGHWTVRRVWHDSPAAKAGIVENDRVLALNGAVLPQAGIVMPCGPETVLEPIDSVRRRIDAAGDGRSLTMTLERDGTRVDVSIRRQPMAAMYSAAQAGGSTTTGPIICMLCEKNCPGAPNNEGYWACAIEKDCDVTVVQCKDRCLTS
jgi:C-terminal processing protease CtpA/Prc